MFYVKYDQIVGLSLRLLRKENNLSQENLSSSIGCANSQYCRYETGDTPVSLTTLREIGLVYELPLGEMASLIQSIEDIFHTKGISVDPSSYEGLIKLEGKSLRAVAEVP